MNVLRERGDTLVLISTLPKEVITQLGGKKKGAEYIFPKSAWVIKRLQAHLHDLILNDESTTESYLRRSEQIGRMFGIKPYDGSWGTGKLSPFQIDAVQYALSTPKHGMLLNFSPGLGKSYTALKIAEVKDAEKILIVCPKSLRYNWKNEIKTWFPNTRFSDKYQQEPDLTEGINITTYETLVKYPQYLINWDIVIFDESLLLKTLKNSADNSSDRAWASFQVSGKASFVVLLSGNPVSRYVDDLYGQLKIIQPEEFKSYWRFARLYCYIEQNIWADNRQGGIIVGSQPINFRSEFGDFIYSVNEREVMNIPEYKEETILIELNEYQRGLYNIIRNSPVFDFQDKRVYVLNTLTELLDLQQVVSNPINLGFEDSSAKDDYILEAIREDRYELPMLIWTHWRESSKALYAKLAKIKGIRVGLFIGGSSTDVLQEYIDGKIDILILGLTGGKFGHNLPDTKTVIIKDFTWEADALFQARYRVRRRTLEHEPVLIKLFTDKTTDNLIKANLDHKIVSINSVTGAQLKELI